MAVEISEQIEAPADAEVQSDEQDNERLRHIQENYSNDCDQDQKCFRKVLEGNDKGIVNCIHHWMDKL